MLTVSPRFFLGNIATLIPSTSTTVVPRVDVFRGGVEFFARFDGRAALVVFDHLGDRIDGRYAQPLGLVDRNEPTDRAVVGFEIRGGNAIDFLGRYGCDPISLEEPQSPIPERRGRAEGLHDRGSVGHGVLIPSLGSYLGSLDFLGRKRLRVHGLDDLQEYFFGLFEFAFCGLG